MANSARGWDIVAIGNGRKYKSKEGRELTASVENNAGRVSINFYEVFGKDDAAAAGARLQDILAQDIPAAPASTAPKTNDDSPWWKFWN